MHFIVVATEKLAPLGRQLAHAISLERTHSGAFWTVKHYKDNEAQLEGKQAVIFLGSNEVAQSYVDVLPERFRGFGTKCSFGGAKAVLVADEPEDVSHDDIASLKRAVQGDKAELRRRAASAASASAIGKVAGLGLVAPTIGLFLWPSALIGGIAYWVLRFMSARKRKQEYHNLQHEYVLSRFLKDEFEAYVGGVEGPR